jgi:hypothetical protein
MLCLNSFPDSGFHSPSIFVPSAMIIYPFPLKSPKLSSTDVLVPTDIVFVTVL